MANNKFKNLFIKEDAPESPASVNAPVQTSAPIPATAAPLSDAASSTPASIASNEEIVGKIWKAIIDQNLPGPDYLELKNNVSALEDLPLTDEQKLVSAFKILKKNYPNFSKDDILRSIDTYMGVVNNEKEGGLAEVAKMRAEKVESNEKLIENLKAEAASIKQRYDEILSQINDLTTTVAAERQTINNKEAMFTASVNTVANTLTADKAKISTLNF